MDTRYKSQLINKLDTIERLERSGYGLTRKQAAYIRKDSHATLVALATAACAILAALAFCVLVIIISLI